MRIGVRGVICRDGDLLESSQHNPALSESIHSMSMKRPALLIVAASVLAACQAPPPAAPARVAVPPSAPREPEPIAAPAPVITPPIAAPASPAAQQQAQKIAQAAVEMLESGNEDQARAELNRAIGVDPQNKLAQNLSRQITADPIAVLGRESFAYTVRPSDTLSRIAGRFLGDVYAFYILARYNDIKVPKQVSTGQVIRVPGKAPPTAASPPPQAPSPPTEAGPRASPPPPQAPAPPPVASPPPPEPTPGERAMRNAAAAERAADLPRARAEYLIAASHNQPGAATKAEQLRTQLVTRYSANARGALARQDLDGAIGSWQRVLELEPDNPTARLELERVRSLKEKFKNVK